MEEIKENAKTGKDADEDAIGDSNIDNKSVDNANQALTYTRQVSLDRKQWHKDQYRLDKQIRQIAKDHRDP